MWLDSVRTDDFSANGDNDLESLLDYLDVDECRHLTAKRTPEEIDRLLAQTLPLQSRSIEKNFLVNGLLAEGYRIGRDPLLPDDERICVIFHYPKTNLWLNIGRFATKRDAAVAAYALINFVRELNIHREGLILIEHILLRPHDHEQRFGVCVKSETDTVLLHPQKLFNRNECHALGEKILPQLVKRSAYHVQEQADGAFLVQLSDDQQQVLVVSPNTFPDRRSAVQYADQLTKLATDYRYDGQSEELLHFYVQNLGEEIPEDFFVFRMSALFPNWTARFRNQEFRQLVRETMSGNVPAHTDARAYFLPIEQADRFDELYRQWLNLKSYTEHQAELDQVNAELVQLLYALYQQRPLPAA
jgi:hypothetical protein